MRAKFLLCLKLDVLWAIDFEICPINRTFLEVLETQLGDGRLLVFAGVKSIAPPLVSSANNHALRERLFARRSEKRINVFLLQIGIRVEEFALDGGEIASGAFLGYKVNAGVTHVVPTGPFHPEPHVTKMIRIVWVFGEKAGNEPLEFVAKVAIVPSFFAEKFKDVVNALAHFGNRTQCDCSGQLDKSS